MQRMEVQACDHTVMATVRIVLIDACFAARTIISVCLVHIALFCASPVRRCLVIREAHTRNRYFMGLVVSRMKQL